jgi:hypothetical protein
MRAVGGLCGVVLVLVVAPVAFGHGSGADERGLGPWSSPGGIAQEAPAAPGRELPQLRTRTSKTFERADGSRVTRVFQQSVHYHDSRGWEPIRNRLEREPDGDLVNAANRYELTVPERLGDGPLRIEHDARWLAWRAPRMRLRPSRVRRRRSVRCCRG